MQGCVAFAIALNDAAVYNYQQSLPHSTGCFTASIGCSLKCAMAVRNDGAKSAGEATRAADRSKQ